ERRARREDRAWLCRSQRWWRRRRPCGWRWWWWGMGCATAGVMTRSLKPGDKVGNVGRTPHEFALSSLAVSETACLSSVTVNVVLVHSSPKDVRITLTRMGKESARPRATDLTTTVVLKDFDSTPIHIFSRSSLSLFPPIWGAGRFGCFCFA